MEKPRTLLTGGQSRGFSGSFWGGTSDGAGKTPPPGVACNTLRVRVNGVNRGPRFGGCPFCCRLPRHRSKELRKCPKNFAIANLERMAMSRENALNRQRKRMECVSAVMTRRKRIHWPLLWPPLLVLRLLESSEVSQAVSLRPFPPPLMDRRCTRPDPPNRCGTAVFAGRGRLGQDEAARARSRNLYRGL